MSGYGGGAGNSTISVSGSVLGTALQQVLMSGEIVPGSDASYQTCKTIYAYHPLGAKMVDGPVKIAQSQKRKLSINGAPEDDVREAFEKQWDADRVDYTIRQLARTSRIYGVASVIVGAEGVAPDKELDPAKLPDYSLFFNVLDPLNTAGSLVLNQDPNAPDFQKHTVITAAGTAYHRSRALVLMNEEPIYIEYTNSAFGYVGRSVYQRALFPLKSFVNVMIANDMIARKLGLIVAKLKPAGSIIDAAMKTLAGVKRSILQQAQTDNVLSVSIDEMIETLDMTNVDGAGTFARTNIIKDIATAADMPAKLLDNETLVSGFGEGTEDAKNIARYVEGIRMWMEPAYQFFDDIVMRRAWNEDFYDMIQKKYPDQYGDVTYQDAFYRWRNSFKASWPSLLEDPEADAKTEDVRQTALLAMLEALLPNLDPDNRATVIQWAVDSLGENRIMFPVPLKLDIDALRQFTPAEPPSEPKPPREI